MYEGNDPKHKARIVQEFLLYDCRNILQSPSQSPDLNPIENLWDKLNHKIRKTSINSKDELNKRLKEEWQRIDGDYLKKIIFNIPTRLKHVLRQKGYPPKN